MPVHKGLFSSTCQYTSNENYNYDIARYWSYLVLVEMGTWKQIKPTYLDEGFIDFLQIKDLCNDGELSVSPKALFLALKNKLETFKSKKPSVDPVLITNLNKITRLISLNKTDIKILAFTIILNSCKGLQDVTDEIGSLTLNQVFGILSQLLDIPYQQVKTALNTNGALFQSGLVRLDRTNHCDLHCRIELMDGLADALLIPNTDINHVFEQYFYPAGLPELKIEDFDYIDNSVQLILRYLQSTQALNQAQNKSKKSSVKGINILLYGEPGTGKSELAKVIAHTLGLKLHEITMSDVEGDPINGDKRFSAYRLAQQVLKRKPNHLIVFDEIEDVFPVSDFDFMGNRGINNKKAWINRILEDNEVPTLWISNSVEQIDNAYKRRFKFVLNMVNPPEATRLKIIKKRIAPLPVSSEMVSHLAQNTELSPAIIAQTAQMLNLMHNSSSTTVDISVIEQDFRHILNNSLEVMGKQKITETQQTTTLKYNINVLNPDKNIKGLLKGLQQHSSARICLYGPPGTGKTAFGHYVAETLGKKLLVRRASDLLDKYVGESEKNIAHMFQQAVEDDAVLLLDEADSFLRDRKHAHRNWEVTQVNELLTQMENFQGIFICSTNLMDDLDEASIRRFDLKIKLNYLKPPQAWVLFRQVLKEHNRRLTQPEVWKNKLSTLTHLTPGDFATVIRQNRLSQDKLSPAQLFEGLKNESDFKQGGAHRSIGFITDS